MKRILVPVLVTFILTVSGVHAQKRATIVLDIDASDAPRNILHANESIAVKPGDLTLFYPKWIPGEHGPTGPVIDVAGLKIMEAGHPVAWRRDLVEMFAIHVNVPSGADQLDITFDFLLTPEAAGFSSGASASAQLALVSWNTVLLYPLGSKPDGIQVTASIKIPDGWKYGTALRIEKEAGSTIRFATVSLTTLIDSPVLTGSHLRKIDLSPKSGVRHTLDMGCESEEGLNISEQQITAYQNLVAEANLLFGAHHYDHYDFLYSLSDHVAHFGLEHHESSDDRVAERTLIDSDLFKTSADLLSHEFVHSWNGKFRRPSGLATGDYSSPMKGDLLWVYEGLTQYLGKILAARSGLRTKDEYFEDQAYLAASLNSRPGRTWRNLQDTGDEAQLLYYTRSDWDRWRRGVDYYDEGDLIWLEVDVTIRKLTAGKKSLDDFCRKFHGGESTAPLVKPYTFDDVVSTLNEVTPNDWRALLTSRLQSLQANAPLGGFEQGGWKLVFKDVPSSMYRAHESVSQMTNLSFSLGMTVDRDATIADVTLDMVAAKSGLAPGMKLIAVNGRKYSPTVLHAAIAESKTTKVPLEILASNRDYFKTYLLDYHNGEQYPYLVRDESKPDLIKDIIAPAGGKK
jgi:predicted metalloprotease with PDZ domain